MCPAPAIAQLGQQQGQDVGYSGGQRHKGLWQHAQAQKKWGLWAQICIECQGILGVRSSTSAQALTLEQSIMGEKGHPTMLSVDGNNLPTAATATFSKFKSGSTT